MTEIHSAREANIKALVENKLSITRTSVLAKYLQVREGEKDLKKPFVCPKSGNSNTSQDLRRRLAAQRVFIPWGSKVPFRVSLTEAEAEAESESDEATPPPAIPDSQDVLPEGIEPLILWKSEETNKSVIVDPMLTKFLRPHQREGVQFMFECVNGLRQFEGYGCILADDMGLGKTLQGITLMWTCLRQSLGEHAPIAKRAIVVCPTSLVSNWDHECTKWLKGKATVLGLSETSRESVISSLKSFLGKSNPFQILIISYETFRIHAKSFEGDDACDLLLCDEAHRLKNDETLTNKALANLRCKRRVLLSGTPMQNHLDEFFAMVNFCNPGILGTRNHFHRHFETPILNGREPDASEEEIECGKRQSEELSSLVNEFILRRTNALLSAHLPPKIIEIVCCRLSPLQESLYARFLASTAAKRLLNGKMTGVLPAITSLKKLSNHPKLTYDQIYSVNNSNKNNEGGFEDCEDLLPAGMFGRSARSGLPENWVHMSGKMSVLSKMLASLRQKTKDRIVIVSNYTQTLDLISLHCHEVGYPVIRLDGSVSIKKRQEMVMTFNNLELDQFVFLLSSKAGGCGLNLIGANRLVLFDPDWNPATDKQAAARVWRDGQKKFVFVYRFLATGTIEEKVFQRQLSKEGLQGLVNKNGKAAASALSAEELRDLFTFQKDTISDTFDSICRADYQQEENCANKISHKKQVGHPAEDDLMNWSHHPDLDTLPDKILQESGEGNVSFVFACEVEGKELEPESPKQNPSKENRIPRGINGLRRLSAPNSILLKKNKQNLESGSLHRSNSTIKVPNDKNGFVSELGKRKSEHPVAQVLKRIHPPQEP